MRVDLSEILRALCAVENRLHICSFNSRGYGLIRQQRSLGLCTMFSLDPGSKELPPGISLSQNRLRPSNDKPITSCVATEGGPA